MFATIKLTRISVAIGAIADIWLVLLMTKNDADYVATSVYLLPIWSSLLATAIIAIGMWGFAASLNDTVDARHDATFHPSRPIPSGWIPIAQAVVVMICSLLIALLAASFLGTWPMRLGLLTAAAILFYNVIGKHVPAIGLVSIGFIYAIHMLIPNIELTFTLPVWLTFTHIMACSIAIYILNDKRPQISTRGWVGVFIGWLIWSIIILSGPLARSGSLIPDGMHAASLIWPIFAILFFVVVIRVKVSNARTSQIAAEKVRRYGALWQCMYATAWLLSLQSYAPAIGIFIFTLASFIFVMIVKEATGSTGKPISWRV